MGFAKHHLDFHPFSHYPFIHVDELLRRATQLHIWAIIGVLMALILGAMEYVHLYNNPPQAIPHQSVLRPRVGR